MTHTHHMTDSMNPEDEAIALIQNINKEIQIALKEIKDTQKDSRPMDSESKEKLLIITDQIKQTMEYIKQFMNRFNKQTSLYDFEKE